MESERRESEQEVMLMMESQTEPPSCYAGRSTLYPQYDGPLCAGSGLTVSLWWQLYSTWLLWLLRVFYVGNVLLL